jgi:hypothetical protein
MIVEQMAVTHWRPQRAWFMETCLLENQMDRMTDKLEQAPLTRPLQAGCLLGRRSLTIESFPFSRKREAPGSSYRPLLLTRFPQYVSPRSTRSIRMRSGTSLLPVSWRVTSQFFSLSPFEDFEDQECRAAMLARFHRGIAWAEREWIMPSGS